MSIIKPIAAIARKLIPLSEYNRPLLQLTKEAKKAIGIKQKSLLNDVRKLGWYEDALRNPLITEEERGHLTLRMNALKNTIAEETQTIREMKIEAYQNQLREGGYLS